MTVEQMSAQTLNFQAEVKQLLHLMIHSLYSNREIFLRELVSNASDACDKLRFEALENGGLFENDAELKIRVAFDKAARTLTVSDNGIGMNREEVIKNIGTIARSGTKEFLAKKRPDVKIVGDELHPLGQVKDFAPYIAKMQAANADSVVTGNWGPDLALLIRAANAAGFKGRFYTFYAGVIGTPTAIGAAGADRVSMVSYWHPNSDQSQFESIYTGFKAKFNDDWYTYQTYNGLAMLSEAMAKAKSVDPVKVAAAMSGLQFKSVNGDVEMRKTDHQLQQNMFISEWKKADAKNPYSVENTGFNFQEVKSIPAYVASTPTSCQMKKP